MRVLLGHRSHREARVSEGSTDIRVSVEVLTMLLAEGLTVAVPRELDPGVARAGAGIHGVADHELVPGRFTGHDGVGDGELHHPVGVEVEHEPPGGPDQRGHCERGQSQLVRREVVEAVERAHRRVEDAFDRQVGQRHPAQRRLVAQALASDGEHRVGGVDAHDPVAPRDQLAGEEAGAAAQIEH